MSDTNRDAVAQEPSRQDSFLSTNRRTFLKGVAGAGAAVSLMSRNAWAKGRSASGPRICPTTS